MSSASEPRQSVSAIAAKTAARRTARRAGMAAAKSAVSVKFGLFVLLALVVLAPVSCVGLLLAGGSSVPAQCLDDDEVRTAMATIRWLESRGDYGVESANSSASGAYQYIDSTWNNYGGYPRAVQAPPSVQDARAREDVTNILNEHGDISFVPLIWYLPATLSRPELMDVVPAGNVLTPREYQQRWLERYAIESSTASTGMMCTGFAAPDLPPGSENGLDACSISWGGYQAGHIPKNAMRYHAASGYLHPVASVAWEQLAGAAAIEGHDISGWGYRSAAASSGAKCSNHEWGLAVDIAFLAGPAGFESSMYAWMHVNGPLYGWVNPRWAKPAEWGGSGRGGWAGGTCCHLEPWHWEYVGQLAAAGSGQEAS